MTIEKVKWEKIHDHLDSETVELLEQARNGETTPQR